MSNNTIDKNYVKLGQLNKALLNKQLPVIDLILSRNFNINWAIPINSPVCRHSPQWLGYTGLHLAVQHNCKGGLNLLLKHGADFTIADHQGFTPLRMALEKAEYLDGKWTKYDYAVVQVLLSAHLISNNPSNPMCKNGMSHLHIACIQNSVSVVELFLKAGVDVNQAVHADSQRCPGYTGLHFALKYRNLELARLLLKHGADLNRKDAKGLTPLHMIIKRSMQMTDEMFQLPSNKSPWYPENQIVFLIMDDIIKSMNVNINNFTRADYVIRSHFHLSCIREQFPEDFENTFNKELNVNAAVSLDSPIFPGYTPLHFAAHFGIEVVLGLLKEGANLSAKDANGLTPHDLIVKRYKKSSDLHNVLKTQLLPLERKLFLDVVLTMDNSSVFYDYLQLKHKKIKQIPFDSQDVNGMTPLHLAFRLGELQIVDKILNSHESITSNPVDAQGLSYLHIACATNKPHLVDMFLEADSAADPDAPVRTGFEFVHGELGRVCIKDGWTALHIAVAVGANETVEALLRRGADPGRVDAHCCSPLHMALMKGNDSDRDVVQRLVAALDAKQRWPDHAGLTRLHIACFHLDPNKIAELLESRADPNAQINFDSALWPGDSPLHILIRDHKEWSGDTIDLLLKHGANVTLQNADGLSPLHLEFAIHNLRYLRDLCRGSNINPVSKSGLSYFHLLCQKTTKEDVAEVRKFLEQGVDVNATVDHFICDLSAGYTPLHYAVYFNRNEALVELLLQYGADVRAEDAYGDTPLHVAAPYFSKLKLAEMILNTGRVDILAKNVLDQTVLELTIKGDKVTTYDLMLLLKYNARVNIYNSLSKEGLLAIARNFCGYSTLLLLMSDATDLTDIDENGRNAVHNIVSTSKYRDKSNIKYEEFVDLMASLLKRGCDIDHRDDEGKTPLHVATIFKNGVAVEALLQLGADISIRDNQNRTPYCKDYRNYVGCNASIMDSFKSHLSMLYSTELYTCSDLVMHTPPDIHDDDDNEDDDDDNHNHGYHLISDNIPTSLQKLEKVKLTEKFTVRDLLREMNFSRISTVRYNAISKFVENLDKAPANVQRWSGLIRLQHRKIAKGMRLLQSASDTFTDMLGFQLPNICIECIFQYLTNKDLENLVYAGQQ